MNRLTVTLVENDVNSLKKPMAPEMMKALKHFEGELLKIRTGRAHTSLIEDLPVACYGQPPVPLKSLAALSAPDTRLLTIQPWDISIIAEIEKSIKSSDLGLSPTNDGKVIKLVLPEMTHARREELTKVLSKKLEECKESIRNTRKEFNNVIQNAKKTKAISEDFFNRLKDVLQEVTDEFSGKANKLAEAKKTSLMTL